MDLSRRPVVAQGAKRPDLHVTVRVGPLACTVAALLGRTPVKKALCPGILPLMATAPTLDSYVKGWSLEPMLLGEELDGRESQNYGSQELFECDLG